MRRRVFKSNGHGSNEKVEKIETNREVRSGFLPAWMSTTTPSLFPSRLITLIYNLKRVLNLVSFEKLMAAVS